MANGTTQTPPPGLTGLELSDWKRQQERQAQIQQRAAGALPEYADDPFAVAFPEIAGQEGSTWEEIGQYQKDLNKARARSVASFLPDRLKGFAKGWRGEFEEGPSWKTQAGLRNDLINLLRLREDSERELKAQEMRHSYQTRAAEATEITALAGIIRQFVAAGATTSSKNADIALKRVERQLDYLDTQIKTKGLIYGEDYENVDKKLLGAFQEASRSAGWNQIGVETPGKGRVSEGIQSEGALLTFLKEGLTGTPGQNAALIARLQADPTIKLDVGRYFGYALDDAGNVYATDRGGMASTAFGAASDSLEPKVYQALQEIGVRRRNDDTYLKGLEENTKMTQQAGAGLPGAAQPFLAQMLNLMNRKKFAPGTKLVVDENGILKPADPAVEGEEAPEEGAPQEAAEKAPSQSMFEEQVEAQIQHLDNPNPPGEVLQRKRDIIDSALFQAWKRDSPYETQDTAYRAFMEEARDRRKHAKAKDLETLQKQRQESELPGQKLKQRLAEGFGALRPRYQRRKKAAQLTSETPTNNQSGSESDAKDKASQAPENE